MNNWYDNPTVSAERAILTKDIIFTRISDIEAEFLIPVFTPTQDNSSGDSKSIKMSAPITKYQKGKSKLVTSSYISSNSITLTIPAYIVNNFYDPFMPENYILKGSEFIITGIGEKTDADKLRIIGFYKLGEGE